MKILDKPLSNLQIELLQLYSQDVSDEDLIAIKRMLARYFADKASDEMDKLWTEKGWTNETMDNWLEDKEGL
ncbi:hypothetical protein [Phaeodactylibacter sp.]|jgi:hypothetical protein|uniref:hypothetical protein n=1 Tax=Phaeodactylibacter sp. TaxID=1940289 RepID=UPI0025F1928A|nr:hypothetical protein [Phaeodactylibacter sp.]MCI4648334.1 hypothetical protein [Phaeodactylibacter sp.]MCI5093987.1 hypothetical protein [Phaeodactylibacter sp.]